MHGGIGMRTDISVARLRKQHGFGCSFKESGWFAEDEFQAIPKL